jgi:hypothetical protein
LEPNYALSIMQSQDLVARRGIILRPDVPGREFREAMIHFGEDDERSVLSLLHHGPPGYYLHYFGHFARPDRDEWLSLGDPTRLAEGMMPDDWEPSAGLFIPPDRAWLVIEEFCRTGQRPDKIEWLRPEVMPEEGIW